MTKLQGKIALITGAASGIGAACALRFVEEGAIVVGFDLNDTAEGDWAAAVKKEPKCKLITGSVTDDDTVAKAVTEIKDEFGSIDIVLASAGIVRPAPVHLVDVADWDLVVDVNLKGIFLVCRHVLPVMLEQGSGNIITISSAMGLEGQELAPSYAATKAGVNNLTRNMAIDYGRKGIRVNAICPGFIETPMSHDPNDPATSLNDQICAAHQLNRLGQPVEVANAAVFLASDDASFITGVALPVDGGWTAGKYFGVADVMGLDY